jgi:hypothetical protein
MCGVAGLVVLGVTAAGVGHVVTYVGQRRRYRRDARHYQDVIESMAADMEADERRHQAELECVRLRTVAEVLAEAHAERQLLIQRHQVDLAEAERKAEARGYVAGVRKRLGAGTRAGRPPSTRSDENRGPDSPRG